MNIPVVNTHRFVKIIKLFLVSPGLQNVLVGLLILIYPLQILFNEFISYDQIRISDLQKIYQFDSYYPILKTEDFYSFLLNDLMPQIYLNFPTPFLLFTPPTLYQQVTNGASGDTTASLQCYQDITVSDTDLCDFTTMSTSEIQLIQQLFERPTNTYTVDCSTQGYLAYYSDCQYSAVLGRSNYTQIIQSMQKHQWIQEQTNFVVFQFSMKNVISNSYFFIKYALEFDSSSAEVLSNQILHSIVQPSDQAFGICMLVFLFILNIVYNLKMLLEFNLVINKWTLVGHLVNILASWAYIGFTSAIEVLSQQISDFSSLNNLDSWQKMQSISALFVFFILPFRVFTWVTQFRQFRWVKKFSNVVFKTFPGMFISLIAFLILFLFIVQLNQAKLYSDLSILFSDSVTVFLTAFDFNSQEVSEKGFKYKQTIPYLLFFPTIVKTISTLLYIYYLSLFIDLVRRAFQLEFRDSSKFESEFHDMLTDLDSKVESTKEVIKEYIDKENEDKLKQTNEKILLYFHLKSSSENTNERIELLKEDISENELDIQRHISSECAENQVTIRKFDDLEQMIQFIICLANIKSQYFSPQTGDKLRIFFYIEHKEFFKENKVNHLNRFLELLQLKGVKCPILYFSSSFQFNHSTQVALRTIYQSSLCSDNTDIVSKFCNMDFKFKSLQKYVHFSNDFKLKMDSVKVQDAKSNNNNNNNNNNLKDLKLNQILSKMPSTNPNQQLSVSNQTGVHQDNMNGQQQQGQQDTNPNNNSGSTPMINQNTMYPQYSLNTYNTYNTYVSQNSSESKDQSQLY